MVKFNVQEPLVNDESVDYVEPVEDASVTLTDEQSSIDEPD